MLKIIKPTDPLKVENICAAWYGEPGIGKTSLFGTIDRALLLDCEQGVQRAVSRTDTVQITDWSEIQAMIDNGSFADYRQEYDTIGIDTPETLITQLLGNYVIQQNPKLMGKGQNWYGAIKDAFSSVFHQLYKRYKFNIVFICHQTDEKQRQGREEIKFKKPKITGSSFDLVMASADIVGYFHAEGGTDTRILDFRPTTGFHYGKDSPNFGRVIVPHATKEFEKWNGFGQSLIDTAIKTMNTMSEAERLKLEELKKTDLERAEIIAKFNGQIQDCKTAEEINQAMADVLKDADVKRLQISRRIGVEILNVKAKELGLEYDKEQKRYVTSADEPAAPSNPPQDEKAPPVVQPSEQKQEKPVEAVTTTVVENEPPKEDKAAVEVVQEETKAEAPQVPAYMQAEHSVQSLTWAHATINAMKDAFNLESLFNMSLFVLNAYITNIPHAGLTKDHMKGITDETFNADLLPALRFVLVSEHNYQA